MPHISFPLERTWSARSAWRTMGISDRACRRAIERGLVPRKALRGEHLIALRVIAAIENFPAFPDAPSEELLLERSHIASKAALECWHQGDPSWLLLVTPIDARLSRDHSISIALMENYSGAPIMLLPIGKWCTDLQKSVS